MPTPPAHLPSTFGPGSAVRAARPGNRTAERLGLAALAAVGVLALAAWQIPPLLDWSRYKGAIASYASSRLGRHVAIGGQVRLTLLPRAMLMADNVTLADRGDGISARLGTLRLEVSLASLLGGHVVPRTLTLDNPIATMPWPLPRASSPAMRPAVAQAFSASLEGGTLQLGGVRLTGIAAVFQTDPDTGAFNAQGSAVVAGLPWRFTALIGAPGRDGIAPVTLTLDGQAPYGDARGRSLRGTGGAFYGRILGDGSVAGRVVLRGPDLSQLGPAPALRWQVQGAVTGDAAQLRAPALDTLLGNAPGHAGLTLHLAAPASIALQASFGQLPSAAWAWRLVQDAPDAAGRIGAQLDLSASAVAIAGATVQAPHIILSLGPQGADIASASAILPGGARLQASGRIGPNQAGFAGRFHLAAPDLHRTLQFLAAGANGTLPGALPGTVLAQADLQGDISVAPARIALTGLSGHADGSQVTGSLALALGAHPALGIDLAVDKLALADWADWAARRQPGAASTLSARFTLGGLAQSLAGLDTDVHLRAADAATPGLPFRNAVLEAHGGVEGLAVHRLAADLPGLHIESSGTIGSDGTIADGRLDLASPEAASLPAAWRQPPKLWRGPFHLALNAAGPPGDIAAQIRADLGDLRAEAEAHLDQAAQRATATVTLRHPGAPRLLDDLGWPGAEAWLDHGSVAVLAHLILSPGHVQAQDFTISAASLHLEGALDADLSGAVPSITGHAATGTLNLPALSAPSPAPLPWDAVRNLDADIQLKADRVTSTAAPDATQVTASLRAGSGIATIGDGQATIAGGQAAFAMVADATQTPPAVSLEAAVTGAAPDGAALAGHSLSLGALDCSASLFAHGFSPLALLKTLGGDASVALRGVSVSNIDLPALTAVLSARQPHMKPQLVAAMSTGATANLGGTLSAALADGAVTIAQGSLAGESGTLLLAGTGALPVAGSAAGEMSQGSLDLTLAAQPAVPMPPTLKVRLLGPFAAPQSQIDVSPALAWAGQLHNPPVHAVHRGKKS